MALPSRWPPAHPPLHIKIVSASNLTAASSCNARSNTKMPHPEAHFLSISFSRHSPRSPIPTLCQSLSLTAGRLAFTAKMQAISLLSPRGKFDLEFRDGSMQLENKASGTVECSLQNIATVFELPLPVSSPNTKSRCEISLSLYFSLSLSLFLSLSPNISISLSFSLHLFL
jgi:hypothetical protein